MTHPRLLGGQGHKISGQMGRQTHNGKRQREHKEAGVTWKGPGPEDLPAKSRIDITFDLDDVSSFIWPPFSYL